MADLTLRVGRHHLDIALERCEDSLPLGFFGGGACVHYRYEPSLEKHFFENGFSLAHQRLCCRIISSFWPLFDPALFEKALPPFLSPPESLGGEVVFFGGTFNPWHEGHSHCVEAADVAPLIVAPDNNPLKPGGGPPPFDLLSSIPEGLFDNPHRKLYLGFLGDDKPNPTAGWVSKLRRTKVSLLVGDDSFMGMDTWRDAEVLLTHLHRLIVVPRLVEDEDFEEQRLKLLGINGHLVIERRTHHPFEAVASADRRSRGS